MKIYVIVSRKNKSAFKKSRYIVNFLEKNGFKTSKHVWSRSVDKKSNLISFVQKQMKAIKEVDVIIFDSAQYTPVVAALIATALLNNKFVLLMHKKRVNFKSLNLPVHFNSSNFLIKNYATNDDLEIVLQKYLKGIKGKLNKRFILNISSEIEQYLDWVSQEWGMNKAEIVRRAVLNAIRADEDYQRAVTD